MGFIPARIVCILAVVIHIPFAVYALTLVTMEYPPYEFEENGKVRGIAVDIVNETFARMKQPITIQIMPWARAISFIERGKLDAIFTIYKNPERMQFADFSNEVLISQRVVFFVRQDSTLTFNSDLTEMAEHEIGLVRGFSYGKAFDQALKQGIFNKVDYTSKAELNLIKLIKRRFDLIVSDERIVYHIAKDLGKTNAIKKLKPELESVPSFIAFSKKRNLSEIRDKFDSILRTLKKEGRYQEIVNRYN